MFEGRIENVRATLEECRSPITWESSRHRSVDAGARETIATFHIRHRKMARWDVHGSGIFNPENAFVA
jgi:hypothetical protein